MRIKHLFTAAVLSVGLGASSASAAVLDLTEVLSFNANSFNSSMIHLQNKGRMNGNNRVIFDVQSTISGGTFDTDTGDIEFDGSVKARRSGIVSAFTATGSLLSSVDRLNGLFGNISFNFTSGNWAGYSLDFIFDDETYKGGEPNGFVSDGVKNHIALWGETETYRKKGRWYCKNNIGKCHGLDLRISYEENDGDAGGVVPLPASFGFLLAGMGGFGFARKLRKKA